jgi:hypothetical protein
MFVRQAVANGRSGHEDKTGANGKVEQLILPQEPIEGFWRGGESPNRVIEILVRPEGFEPPTRWFVARCSFPYART